MAGHRRGMPADFMKVAPGLGVKKLAKHYQCGQTTARRWLIEAELHNPRHYAFALPDNIADLVQTMSISDIAEHIGASASTIGIKLSKQRPELHALARANGVKQAQQRATAGNKAKATARKAARAAARAAECLANPPAKRMPLSPSGRRNTLSVPDRQDTLADQARAFLQPFGPCFSRKVYARVFDDYEFRGRVYTPRELIAEARKRGWQPDAWRQVAA